jgi:antitoxin VapB
MHAVRRESRTASRYGFAMSIVIDNPELERQLRALADQRGESVEDVLFQLTGATAPQAAPAKRAETQQERDARLAEVQRIIDRIHAEIAHDPRSPEEIIGYDADGLPR